MIILYKDMNEWMKEDGEIDNNVHVHVNVHHIHVHVHVHNYNLNDNTLQMNE